MDRGWNRNGWWRWRRYCERKDECEIKDYKNYRINYKNDWNIIGKYECNGEKEYRDNK